MLFRSKQIKGVKILKNEPLPQTIPKLGIIFIRDGTIGEAEILLSPPRAVYQHKAEIEIVVQEVEAEDRDKKLDDLLELVANVVASNHTLNGKVDYCLLESPEFVLEAPDGVVPIKAGIISVILEYFV